MKAESCLIAAVPSAMGLKPEDRTDFDRVTVEMVSELLVARISILSGQIAENTETVQEVNAEALGAWAIYDTCRDGVTAAIKELNMAQAALRDAEEARKASATKARVQRNGLEASKKEQEMLQQNVQEIDAAVIATQQLLEARVEEAKVVTVENGVSRDDCVAVSGS